MYQSVQFSRREFFVSFANFYFPEKKKFENSSVAKNKFL